MPILPSNTLCGELGCKNNRSKGNRFCTTHGGFDHFKSDKRKESNKAYGTRIWQKIRTRQLSIQPLCQSCLSAGRVCLAKDIDHVFAWNVIGDHSFTRNLFQSLCQPCHSHKTQLEQKGVYRHFTTPITDYCIADYYRLFTS
jgi:5-methylcytosine-specific restriction protein A